MTTAIRPLQLRLHSRTRWLYGLLVCMLFQAAMPVGFMPGVDSSGAYSWLTLCYGNAGSAQLQRVQSQELGAKGAHSPATAHTHHAHHHAVHSTEHNDKDGIPQASHHTGDHSYCPFAGVLAGDPPYQSLTLAVSPRTNPVAPMDADIPSQQHFRQQLPRAPPASLFIAA